MMPSDQFTSHTTVNLFVTCLVDTLFPKVGEAVVKVLNRAGFMVNFPVGQTCCGQPAFNAGLWSEARQMAEHTISVLEAHPGPVIIPSGSCAAMIRHSYPVLFEKDENNGVESSWLARAKALAARTYEFSEFLVEKCQQVDFGARFPGPVTYHASCHLLRGLGIDKPPMALLRAVRDARFPDQIIPLEFIEMNGFDECCGFGGVFSVEQPQISAAMLTLKMENIHKSGATTVVCCDAGCLANIAGGLVHRQKGGELLSRIRVMHLAEILAFDSTQI